MERQDEVEIKDCTDCAWSVRAEEHDSTALSRLVIDHAIRTGHDIETRRVRSHVW